MDELYPNDSLSASLLESIPKKVSKWLAALEQSYNLSLINVENTEIGRLTIEIYSNGGAISVGESGDYDFEKIWWDGNFDEITNVRVSNLALVEAAVNLEDFISLERNIYNELQAFQEEQERRAPTSRMPQHFDTTKNDSTASQA